MSWFRSLPKTLGKRLGMHWRAFCKALNRQLTNSLQMYFSTVFHSQKSWLNHFQITSELLSLATGTWCRHLSLLFMKSFYLKWKNMLWIPFGNQTVTYIFGFKVADHWLPDNFQNAMIQNWLFLLVLSTPSRSTGWLCNWNEFNSMGFVRYF